MPLYGQKKFDVINRPHPRMEGIEKVTGKARYAADIYMEDMLYAGMLRSPYSSARVVSINTDSRSVSGEEAFATVEKLVTQLRSQGDYFYYKKIKTRELC